MAISTFKRSAAAAGAFGVVGASLFGASGAVAAEYECELPEGFPAPMLVADGVCEIIITESGSYTVPSSLGKVAAIVVGGGGGGSAFYDYDYYAYGGGGGQVQYVDEVALDAPIAVTIGEGGDGISGTPGYPGYAEDGEDTLFGDVTAFGGKGADLSMSYDFDGGYTYGDDEYFTELDFNYYLGGGAGTAGDAEGEVPGDGYFPAEIPGADPDLLAGGDIEYGKGGTPFALDLGDITPLDEIVAFDLVDETPLAVSNSGEGGHAGLGWNSGDESFWTWEGFDGQDGAVVLRYAAPEPELAATGAEPAAALIAGGVAALGGAALVAAASRRRRSA